MGQYAQNTSVSVDRSIAEIRNTTRRYGADQFGHIEGSTGAQVMFRIEGRMIRISLELPDPGSEEFAQTPSGRRRRDKDASLKAWKQACRQRWRALTLFVKATLEAIECNIMTIDQAFLTHIMLPDGQTAGEFLIPQVEQAYLNGKMPKMLMEPRE